MEPTEAVRYLVTIGAALSVWLWAIPRDWCKECDHCRREARLKKEAKQKEAEDGRLRDHMTWHVGETRKRECPWCVKESGAASAPASPTDKEKK